MINEVMLAKPPIPKVTIVMTSKTFPHVRSLRLEMIIQEEIMIPSKVEPKRNKSDVKNDSFIFSSSGNM
jgi:hypothetical protein